MIDSLIADASAMTAGQVGIGTELGPFSFGIGMMHATCST